MSTLASRPIVVGLIAASMMTLAVLPSPRAQSTAPTTDTSRGLTIGYTDGRVSTRPLRLTGSLWTMGFPKMTGVDTSRDGLPLSALDLKHVVEGTDVVVTVSLSYGGPTKNLVKVATVRVSPGSPAHVEELQAYGVEPITLSLVSIPATAAFAPEAVSASAQVDLLAEPLGPNASAYRVVVTNRSSLPLIWFHYQALRNGHTAVTARPRGKRNAPIVMPHAEYAFEIAVNSVGQVSGDGPEAWQPLDRIDITSLMWQDGLVEGNAAAAIQQAAFDRGRATQIRTLLTLLRGARDHSIASLRPQIARAMTFDVETQQGRDSILADLEALERTQRSREGQDFETWLTRTIAEYQEWLARIVLPKL